MYVVVYVHVCVGTVSWDDSEGGEEEGGGEHSASSVHSDDLLLSKSDGETESPPRRRHGACIHVHVAVPHSPTSYIYMCM